MTHKFGCNIWDFARFSTIVTFLETWKRVTSRKVAGTKNNTPSWVVFTFLKLYRWSRIAGIYQESFVEKFSSIRFQEEKLTSNFFQATWKQRCMQTKNYCKKQIPKRSFTWQSWNGGKQYFQSKHSRHLRDRLKLLQANKKTPTAFKKVVGESLFSIFDQFRDITLVLSHTILSKFLILIRHTNVSKPLVQTLSRDIEMEHGCKMGQWF